jgi:hypothetical protein
VNCEEGMREKNEMGEGGMYVCGGGEEKRKAGGYMSGGEKEKDIKKKKEMGVGFTCMVGKKWGVEKKEENKFEREKTKLILFVCSLCLVQSIEL